MTFNLNKSPRYYYSKNDITIGPLTIYKLLVRIDADTLVFVEGGKDWEKAKHIQKLKKFFTTK